jgi:hypothetical protein
MKVPLVKSAGVYAIAYMEPDVTTWTDNVQMGIVILDGNHAHVLKVKSKYFFFEIGLYA